MYGFIRIVKETHATRKISWVGRLENGISCSMTSMELNQSVHRFVRLICCKMISILSLYLL